MTNEQLSLAKSIQEKLTPAIPLSAKERQLNEMLDLAKLHSIENAGIRYFVSWDSFHRKYYVTKMESQHSRYCYINGRKQVILQSISHKQAKIYR